VETNQSTHCTLSQSPKQAIVPFFFVCLFFFLLRALFTRWLWRSRTVGSTRCFNSGWTEVWRTGTDKNTVALWTQEYLTLDRNPPFFPSEGPSSLQLCFSLNPLPTRLRSLWMTHQLLQNTFEAGRVQPTRIKMATREKAFDLKASFWVADKEREWPPVTACWKYRTRLNGSLAELGHKITWTVAGCIYVVGTSCLILLGVGRVGAADVSGAPTYQGLPRLSLVTDMCLFSAHGIQWLSEEDNQRRVTN